MGRRRLKEAHFSLVLISMQRLLRLEQLRRKMIKKVGSYKRFTSDAPKLRHENEMSNGYLEFASDFNLQGIWGSPYIL